MRTEEEKRRKKMTNDKRLFMDVHVVQSVPPSCVNRDDTGSPKTAFYGGTLRARVSSQSWKHAMREYFKSELPTEDVGIRTKKVKSLLSEELSKNGVEDAGKVAEELFKIVDIKINDEKSDALFFISENQVKALAELYLSDNDIIKNAKKNKDIVKEALNSKPGIDIALFGRMLASNPELNTDASAQVAHAISTHTIVNEYDYFTAVDDLQDEDNAGAGHIGTSEFNSSTLYRYTTVAVHSLNEQIGGKISEAIKTYIEAFCLSMPGGKMNSYANKTLPDAIMINLRTDQPLNLVGAFEEPVVSESGYVEKSLKELAEYANESYEMFKKPLKTYVLGKKLKDKNLEISKDIDSFDEMTQVVAEDIVNYLNGISD